MDVNLIPLVAVVLGGLSVLIPITGLTARFALKPIIEAITTLRAGQEDEKRTAFLEQRLALVEEQLHAIERDHQRLLEADDFRRQLESPLPRPAASD